MKNQRKYEFNKPQDMITLAQFVQTKVYWGSAFYFGDDDESVGYDCFWDYCDTEFNDGKTTAVIIEDEKYVSFI